MFRSSSVFGFLLSVACVKTDASRDTVKDVEDGDTLSVLQTLNAQNWHQPALAVDLDPDPNVVRVSLVAEPVTYMVGEQVIEGYGYNGQVPGPTIKAKEAESNSSVDPNDWISLIC